MVKERRLNLRMHNGWRWVTMNRPVGLNEPNQYGIMSADQAPCIKDCLINDYIALVFELVYVVEVRGRPLNVVLGYQAYMPDINTIMKIEQTDIDTRLIRGPAETLDDDLILPDVGDQAGGAFEFSIRAWVSQSQVPPDAATMRRSYTVQSTKTAPEQPRGLGTAGDYAGSAGG